jgi:hypothetical protein
MSNCESCCLKLIQVEYLYELGVAPRFTVWEVQTTGRPLGELWSPA